MNVLLFQGRFEALIVGGQKVHTIRPHRRDGRPRARVGEALSLRVWSGLPYRSPQREFARGVVIELFERLSIEPGGVDVGSDFLMVGRDDRALRALANQDGFATWAEMRDWFAGAHGLPFMGVLIRWRID